MEDVLAMAAQDAAKPATTRDEDLQAIGNLAEQQVKLEGLIAEEEEKLKELKKTLARIAEQDLPEAMDKVKMSEFKLQDGSKITIKKVYRGSIPAERKPEAMDWLDGHGHGGLIKTEVSVPFAKGQLEVAREFAKFARGFNGAAIDPEVEQSVHHSTLSAFIREQIEDGAAIPHDLFGVFIGRKANVKQPK